MDDPKGTLMVVSAHAADFVWRAAGAIAFYSSRRYRVRVAKRRGDAGGSQLRQKGNRVRGSVPAVVSSEFL